MRIFICKHERDRDIEKKEKSMGTPNKNQIIDAAFKKYHERNPQAKGINPETSELLESGIYEEAKNQLMRDQDRSQVLSYLEQLANENGFELVKAKTEYDLDLEPYPVEAIMTEGCFATGGRGVGKSNLLKLLVMEALNHRIRVKVFDPSLAWKDFPLVQIKVKRNSSVGCSWDRIYDISRLSVLEAIDFVKAMMTKDLSEAIQLTDIGMKPSCLVVIEEAQNIIPTHSLRSKKFLEVSRFISQGRNFGLSYVCSTQRLSSVDINLIELSGTRYWFKLEGHRNLVKARYWLNKYTSWRLRNLDVGACYVQVGSRIRLLRLPKFQAKEVLVRA